MLTQDSYILFCKLTDNSLNDIKSFVDFFFLPGVLRFKAFLPIPTHWTPQKCRALAAVGSSELASAPASSKISCARSSDNSDSSELHVHDSAEMHTAILANQLGSEAHTPQRRTPRIEPAVTGPTTQFLAFYAPSVSWASWPTASNWVSP